MGDKLFFWEGGGIKFEFWWGEGGCQEPTFESTKQPQCPSGGPVITLSKTRPKAEFDGTGGGMDGDQKCPLNFFKLCRYLEIIYIYIYIYIHNFILVVYLCCLKNLILVWLVNSC